MQRGPLLEGREEWYLKAQMLKFRSGLRGGETGSALEKSMASVAAGLSDADIEAYSQFFASQPKPRPAFQAIRGDAGRGKLIYAACAPCHGPNGEGDKKQFAPALASLEDWHLHLQLENFKAGRRGTHPQDLPGQAMAAAVTGLTSEDIKDVVAYIRNF